MQKHRRLYVPGATYFFTVRLRDPSATLLIDNINLLRSAVRVCQNKRPFKIEAAVVMPSVAHMIWKLPDGDADFSSRWKLIKATFSTHVPAPPDRTPQMIKRGNKGIWHPRFWEHMIRDQDDYDLHDHLIATAPFRAGLVAKGGAWPYSSAHKLDAKTIAPVPSVQDQAIAATATQKAPSYTTEMR